MSSAEIALPEKDRLPNLFVIGAPKCGTTTMFSYLNNHPDISPSIVKEPAFFDKDRNFSEQNDVLHDALLGYLEMFPENNCRYRLDATPCFAFPKVANRISRLCGNESKFIFLIRDPVDRALSHYWHAYKLGLQMGDVENEIFDEYNGADIFDTGKFPKNFLLNGLYTMHMERFKKYFGKEAMHLINFDDFVNSPEEEMVKLFKFLGLKEIEISSSKINASQMPLFPGLQRFLEQQNFAKKVAKSIMPHNFRQLLRYYFNKVNLKSTPVPDTDESLIARLEEFYQAEYTILYDEYGIDLKSRSMTS